MDNYDGKYCLSELQKLIKEKVEGLFPRRVWLCAEIGEIKQNATGHCYLTLIEKSENDSAISAKAQAIIWASTYRVIKPFFETSTGSPLCEGMNVLVRVQVQYTPLFGLSLIIYDIDPAFTVGEVEIQRQNTIKRLTKEGMMEMNSTLTMPRIVRNIAVVSSDTAAGYGDFMKHLGENEYGFHFNIELFNAPMQGKEAVAGIISALDRIAVCEESFDTVIILRGGGSSVDLSCFDEYDLAVNVAQFPLPVMTAIGHERDYHVADMVAFMHLKTPTAVADMLVDMREEEAMQIESLATRLLMALKEKKTDMVTALDGYKMRIRNAISNKVNSQMSRLEIMEFKINAMNPQSILEKGFNISLKNGEKVVSVSQLTEGDRLTMLFKDGTAECEVLGKNKKDLIWKRRN